MRPDYLLQHFVAHLRPKTSSFNARCFIPLTRYSLIPRYLSCPTRKAKTFKNISQANKFYYWGYGLSLLFLHLTMNRDRDIRGRFSRAAKGRPNITFKSLFPTRATGANPGSKDDRNTTPSIISQIISETPTIISLPLI